MAHAMRHLSATLAELVPDITIRTRAEVEAEEAAADAEDDVHSDTEEKPVKSSRKAGGFSSKGVSKKGASSMSRGPLHEELENKLLNGVREGSVAGSHDGRSASQVNGLYSTPPPAGTPTADMDTQLDPAQVAQQARDEKGDEGDEGDVLSKEWNARTQQARAKYALHRHKLLRKPLGEDELGYIRTKKGMIKFKEWEGGVYDVVRFEEPVPELDPEADDELPNEEDSEEDQFLAQYDLASGVLNGLQNQYDEESLKELYSRERPSEYCRRFPELTKIIGH
jgi:transcriptional activator SPT7